MKNSKKKLVCVQGMHCASCDILVKTKLEEDKNVINVNANHATQEVEIEYDDKLDLKSLQNRLTEYGYKIVEKEEFAQIDEPFAKRLTDAILLAMVAVILYLGAQELNLIPAIDEDTTFSLLTIFGVGLIASVSTCMATTGALFLATVGKLHNDTTPWKEKFVPAISFNIGRILTYALFGFINGFVGKLITTDLQAGSVLNGVVGIMMVLIGLDMLRIFSVSTLLPDSFLKKFFVKVENRLIKHPKRTAFFLGVITYWLPCGFTQTVQLYALAVADPIQSMLIMLVFAIGTTPALLAIGFASSVMKSSWYSWFMKFVGVSIVLAGLAYVLNFLHLYGLNPFSTVWNQVQTTTTAQEQNGIQVLRMSVSREGYAPASFVVEHGKPVRWIINGEQVIGCQGLLNAPKIGLSKVLEKGENIVEFTPKEKGDIGFSCSNGSYGGIIHVI